MKRLSLIAILLLFVIAIPVVVRADTAKSKSTTNILNNLKEAAGGQAPEAQGRIFPAGDLPTIANRVLATFFALLGLIFLGMMLYGGYNWLTAMGEEEKVETAKKTITAAFIGLAIVIASYAVTDYIIKKLYSGGGGSTVETKK